MVQAHMVTADGMRRQIRQPGDQLIIDGNCVQVSETEVAVHTAHAWILGHRRFVVLKISSRVTVRFETDTERSPEFGPFDQLWIVDGWILNDLDRDTPLAHFLYPESAWLLLHNQSLWGRVAFTDAP